MALYDDEEYIESLPQILTPQGIAIDQQLDPNTVLSWIKRGLRANGQHIHLKAYKVGVKWRVRKEDWLQFLRDCDPEPFRIMAEQQAMERRNERRKSREYRTGT